MRESNYLSVNSIKPKNNLDTTLKKIILIFLTVTLVVGCFTFAPLADNKRDLSAKAIGPAEEFLDTGYDLENVTVYGSNSPGTFNMNGREYYQGIVFDNTYYSSEISYNVENVDSISFTLGHVDDMDKADASLHIYLDNVEIGKFFDLTYDMELQNYTVDTSGASVMRIYLERGNYSTYALANISVDGYVPEKTYSIPEYGSVEDFLDSSFNSDNTTVYSSTSNLPIANMNGREYYQGIVFDNTYYSSEISYNVENVDSISFTLGHVDDKDKADATLHIYLDNVEIGKFFDLTYDMELQNYTVDTSGASVMRIYLERGNTSGYAIGNIEIDTDDVTPPTTTTTTTSTDVTTTTTETSTEPVETSTTSSTQTTETTEEPFMSTESSVSVSTTATETSESLQIQTSTEKTTTSIESDSTTVTTAAFLTDIPPEETTDSGNSETTVPITTSSTTTSVTTTVPASGPSGFCGADDNEQSVLWSFDTETGTLTVSGLGKMASFMSIYDAPWFEYYKNIKHVVIERGVTDIGDCAFENCTNLGSIIIPDSITEIGEIAFYECLNLRSVTLPDSVTDIKDGAFSFTGLNSVTIMNPYCEIYDSPFTFSNADVSDDYMSWSSNGYNGTIYGYENSTAQAYAEKYSYKFSSLDGSLNNPGSDGNTVPGGNDTDINLGDIDGSGSIDSSDASIALQEYALLATGQKGKLNASQTNSADVNTDGSVDSSDASTILRYYAYTATGGKDPFDLFLKS